MDVIEYLNKLKKSWNEIFFFFYRRKKIKNLSPKNNNLLLPVSRKEVFEDCVESFKIWVCLFADGSMMDDNGLTSLWNRTVTIRKIHYHRIYICFENVVRVFMLSGEKIYSFQFGKRYVRFTSHIFHIYLNTFLPFLESSCIRVDSSAYFKFPHRRNFSSKSLFCKKKKKELFQINNRCLSSFDRILLYE